MPETVADRLLAAATCGDAVVLEGLHAVKHAIRFGADIELVATADPAAALQLAAELCPDILPALRSLLRVVESPGDLELGGRPIATGLCGIANRPEFDVSAALRLGSGPIVLLDNPRSLANVGAAIRASAAASVAAVLTTGEHDPWHPISLRGSAGLHFAQPVESISIDDLTGERPIIGFDADSTPFAPSELPLDAVLVFGSERRGISRELRERCASLVSLPMQPGVSSLNLATSVAAVLMSWRIQSGWLGR